MNDLLKQIKETTARIDDAMTGYLGGEGRPYAALISSMRYSAYAGGKRIRPFLTLAFAAMLGGNEEAALPYACAIEMIHTYSLIHDDLPCMDNDDERRGKPTNHKVYGEATALLAGDALLTYAFEVAAENPHTKERNAEAVALLARNAGFDGMIGGQALDLMGEREELSHELFLQMNRLKTGCLIQTACLLGCLAAGYGKGSAPYAAAAVYAEKIGLAFQIEDDLLDAGTEDHKTTFLTFLSEEEAREKIAALTEEAIAAVAPYETNGLLSDFARYLSSRTV